jgi:uncharacterized protein YegP (UPF0339 family)
LAEAGKGKTDWALLAKMDDIEISARALADPDTLLLTDTELGVASLPAVSFVLYKDQAAEYRWRLIAKDGTEFAVSPAGFRTRKLAREAVLAMLFALGQVEAIAA